MPTYVVRENGQNLIVKKLFSLLKPPLSKVFTRGYYNPT